VAALKARRFELVAALASLRLEQARIDATLEGDASFGSAVDGWETAAALLSPERLASERAVMLADLAAAQARDAQFAARVDELVERTAVSQENVTASKNHLAYLTERRDAFRQLFDRGVVTEAKVDDATMQMMATQRILFQQEDTLMGLEADLRMAAHDQAVTRAEREQRLRIAARDVEEEAGLVFEQEQSVKAQLKAYEGDIDLEFLVTIERPEIEGLTRFTAERATSVRPGDLVTVTLPMEVDSVPEMPIAGYGRTRPGPEMPDRVISDRVAVEGTGTLTSAAWR
jgi:hypothetical protein